MNELKIMVTIGSASIGRWAGPGSDGQSPLAGQPSSLSRSLLRALQTFVFINVMFTQTLLSKSTTTEQ